MVDEIVTQKDILQAAGDPEALARLRAAVVNTRLQTNLTEMFRLRGRQVHQRGLGVERDLSGRRLVLSGI